ncbi:hypothetical protein HMPREF9123_1458 [Neisseria bacilliformis ATCC BAA-1200]|uniref:Uncharacterized protein n=1 Tax=Neisseria bacilliformis ATCC BAA-1200 TaxID=888742 RepID=F2BCN3_9NEIS|nr:hypothetical protein HMPREF9123_1458 [Neisseria bacilliformis ATCC BAA-1200]
MKNSWYDKARPCLRFLRYLFRTRSGRLKNLRPPRFGLQSPLFRRPYFRRPYL